MRKIMLLLIVMAAAQGCSPVSQKEISRMALNGLLDIKIPCRSAEWDAVTTVEEGKKFTSVKSKILYREGRFRLEIAAPGNEYRQVILLDEKNLYVFGADNTAYKYGTDMREAEVFLRKIFVNTGAGRKPEIKTGEAEYNGQKCDIFEYALLRNVNGLYAKTKVREWRNNRGATVKMQADVGPAEFLISGSSLVVGPLKETYEVSNYKCGGRLMGMLFEVPVGMKVVDYREEYAKKLRQSGKKIPADSGRITMTVKPAK